MHLIDTHTHADVPQISHKDITSAYKMGVRHIVLIGYLAKYFSRMRALQQKISRPTVDVVYGLHPLYISEHDKKDLDILAHDLQYHPTVAIGEIGLDFFDKNLKSHAQAQIALFEAQIDLAKQYNLPMVLHIRKAHAEVLQILKRHFGQKTHIGIAHAFSGGVQEALAFCKLGYKIGITAQITNPNAKKLHHAIRAVYARFGASAFVIETDCPDFLPFNSDLSVNTPMTLPKVAHTLADFLELDVEYLCQILWQNSHDAYAHRLSAAF